MHCILKGVGTQIIKSFEKKITSSDCLEEYNTP